jgi:uncharacterized protein (DUF302 family)
MGFPFVADRRRGDTKRRRGSGKRGKKRRALGPKVLRAPTARVLKSIYPFAETIERLKKDIAAKGIRFFSEIDQTKLAADAGIKLDPSTLLVFGNPPLGTQFIAANPNAGLDWPVRLLVTQGGSGAVWTVYTDFAWIAARHGIVNRTEQFKMASMVIASITSSVKA